MDKSEKLFNFYCNPCIYNLIMDVLSKTNIFDNIPTQFVRWLEEILESIHSYTLQESWQELVCKSRELLKSSKRLEDFAQHSFGILCEIKAADYLIKNLCQHGDLLIFLENDNGKKKKSQNCDLMLILDNKNEIILAEATTKLPRHGVASDIGLWDDFFNNFYDSIYGYLSYLESNVSPIWDCCILEDNKNLN